MVNLTAPDRRVGLFFSSTTPPQLNTNGWAIFDAAVLWATGSDADGDGLTIYEELVLGTDPRNADTNGDGIPDGTEISMGLSPTNLDMDGDGIPNATEIANGTDPFAWDTDGDDTDQNDCSDRLDAFPLDPTRCTLDPNSDTTPSLPPDIALTDPPGASISCTTPLQGTLPVCQ